MTHIIVKKSNNLILGFVLEGHTGYGVCGEDIVCAGLSAIAQTACLGLKEVVGSRLNMARKEDNAYLECFIPMDLSEEEMHDCQVILNTAYLGLKDLKSGYSDFIKLEVEKYVY